MTVPRDVGHVLGAAGFRHYAFISYPATDRYTKKLAVTFHERLEAALSAHLPPIELPGPSEPGSPVYLAPVNNQPGDLWPERLDEALLGSVAMVALVVPMYAHPLHPWCGRELAGMLDLHEFRGGRRTPVVAVELGQGAIDDRLRAKLHVHTLTERPIRGLEKTAAFDQCVFTVVNHVTYLVADLYQRRVRSGPSGFRIPAQSWFDGPPAPPALPNRMDEAVAVPPAADSYAVPGEVTGQAAVLEDSNRRVTSFYSYKGGTGRTMAVANIGAILAESHVSGTERVLLIDWDLDAPGLHVMFSAATGEHLAARRGLIDFFTVLQDELTNDISLYQRVLRDPFLLDEIAPTGSYICRDVFPSLDLLTAGCFDGTYRAKASSFDWAGFWQRWPGVFRAWRKCLERHWEHVLIDCRTGFGDVSCISSTVLPSRIVIVFVPNDQNLWGSLELASRAVDFRRRTDELRPPGIFPLPSRVMASCEVESRQWRHRYQREFEKCFARLYHDPACDLTGYFDAVRIPNVASFAFGEQFVVLAQEERARELRGAYEEFARVLLSQPYPWTPGKDEAGLR